MRLSFLALSLCVFVGCGGIVVWPGDEAQPNEGGSAAAGPAPGGSTGVNSMGIWDEVACPGYFDEVPGAIEGLGCPAGCPVWLDERGPEPGLANKLYCAAACGVDNSCPLGTECFDGLCLFRCTGVATCRPETACFFDIDYCAPEVNGLVPCGPYLTEGSCANGCYASLELPDGSNFCTIDCAYAVEGVFCVAGATCAWDAPPLPDGRKLCLPICESDADCIGGLTCKDGSCQWPAIAP
jgi:hypothetical protein